jgi:pSer/pThr/pTyr-binding forkhead associated (FHA) protein
MSTGWTTRISSTGKVFYYNSITKEKSWKQPDGFVPPPPPRKSTPLVTAERSTDIPTPNSDAKSTDTDPEYLSTPDPRYLIHKPTGNYFEIATGHFWKWDKSKQQYFNLTLQKYVTSEDTTLMDATSTEEARLKLVISESIRYPKGSLIIVDQDGLKFGRDKLQDSLELNEIAVSRYHCQIYFRKVFWLVDVGSSYGTMFNGVRMSQAKEPSEPVPLTHGDVFEVGSSKFSVHLHPSGSCPDCDVKLHPIISIGNQYIIPTRRKERVSKKQRMEQERQKGIQMMKEAYGIEELQNVELPIQVGKPLFTPAAVVTHKKIEASSLQKQVQGKGKDILLKMGWKEKGLGKDELGRLEPIELSTQKGTKGLGN